VRSPDLTKPVAIILNPNSGLKLNLTHKVQEFFTEAKIPFEIFPTKKAGDSFTIPNEINLEKYSALIACGGDGTVFEVVNGMLERPDGLKVPIGIIPNGSGNAGAGGLGILNMKQAFEAIKSKTVIKHDVFRTIIDTENNEDIPRGKDAFKKKRTHSVVALAIGNMKHLDNATPFKPYLGNGAYGLAGLWGLITGSLGKWVNWDVTVDGDKIKSPGYDHLYSMVISAWHHNKIPSDNQAYSSVCNDGLFDLHLWNND